MAVAVYVLCAATSTLCAVLLARAWAASRSPLLLWCLLGFAGLALNNVLLVVDEVAVPGTDLSFLRTLPALLGVVVLAAGLIWETRSR